MNLMTHDASRLKWATDESVTQSSLITPKYRQQSYK